MVHHYHKVLHIYTYSDLWCSLTTGQRQIFEDILRVFEFEHYSPKSLARFYKWQSEQKGD